MAISGVGGLNPIPSFRETNVQLNQIGRQVTSEKMEKATPQVSNFGNETHAGSSQFQQINNQIEQDAVSRISQIMERDDDIVEAPALGNGTNYGSSGFQQLNDTSFNPEMQRAASSYSYFNQ